MKTSLLSLLGANAALASIVIIPSTKYQEITGFGFSQAFTRASQFQAAESTLQKQALDLLFDTETGAGFSIIRNWIPSTTEHSIEPASPGSANSTPVYTWDGDDYGQVWFSTQAASYGVSTIYADAWSAPGFMKTSGNEATAGYLCGTTGHTCSTGDWKQAYADYLVQYVKFYQEEGLKITHLGFLNEPDFSPSYSQMQISDNAQEAIDFIPILYQTVQDAGLSLNLTCCDAMGWDTQSSYTDYLVKAGMEKYLDVITSHMYTGDATFELDTSLPAWISEAGDETGDGGFVTTWYSSGLVNEGMTWANKLAEGFTAADLSAYIYWEGFEINQTQSASHLVDTSGDEPLLSGIYYAFTMWSRFIRPGAYRIATSGTLTNVVTAAFQNTDDSVVVVLTNSGSSSQTAELSVSDTVDLSSVQAWVTDNDSQVVKTTVSIGTSSVSVTVPARGVVTVKFTAGGDDNEYNNNHYHYGNGRGCNSLGPVRRKTMDWRNYVCLTVYLPEVQ
ncbi:glycoside hydrolase superfamily [Aspergillus pseudoustus]|uniref:Glycoside hydrolase superfamily n=1 Tax=Aspergillus pseudoustus TaxID=1810923 RepID=A0ABR4INZ1_9EURO